MLQAPAWLTKILTTRAGQHGVASERATEIDFLRSVAALSVLFYHYTYRRDGAGGQLFPLLESVTRYGYLGVNLFFMISGFVILWTALGRTPSSFARSRFLRLYPTFWVCMVVTLVVIHVFTGGSFQLSALLKNATMIAGYLNAEYVDGVYWTLQLELKFYALVYLMLLFGQVKYAERWLFIWLAAAVFCEHVSGTEPLRMLVIYPYAFYFIAGCLFFLVRREGWAPTKVAGLVVCLVYSGRHALIESGGFLFDSRRHEDIVVVVAIVVIFFSFVCVTAERFSHLFGRWAVRVGALTYPIYLLHNTAGKLFFDALRPHLGREMSLLLTIVGVLIVAQMVSYVVEEKVGPYLDRVMRASVTAIAKMRTSLGL